MSALRTLYRGATKIDFVGQSRRWFTVSAAVLVVCTLSLGIRTLNLSIDFTGGTAIEVPNPNGIDIGAVRDSLGDQSSAARIQLIDDGASVRVQTEAVELETERELVLSLIAATGASIEETDVQSVGPTFGRQIAQRAAQALIVFLIVVVVFISLRFEWKMAVGAITALFHDLLITFGAYSILGFEVTPATVVAILTILGYSLYDTVVVFDMIKENVTEDQDRSTYSDLVNQSMNQVLHAVDQYVIDQPPAGWIPAVHRFTAPGRRDASRICACVVRWHRSRHVLINLHRGTSFGAVEGARGRMVPPALSSGQERDSTG